MKTVKPILALTTTTLCLMAFAVHTSSAQPTGSLTNQIVGATNKLWDISRITDLQNLHLDIEKVTRDGTTQIQIAYTNPFTQSGGGKFAGVATNDVTLMDDSDTYTFPAKCTSGGSITSSKGVGHINFKSTAAGKVTFQHDTKPTAVACSVQYVVTFNAVADQVTGRAIMHAAAAGKGSRSQTTDLEPGTLSEMKDELGDGTWTLVLNFDAPPATNKLKGIASVTLNSGQVYPFAFTGTYNPKNQQSKLNLKGFEAGKGSILQVMLVGNELTKATGRVSGQSVNIK